ncbi:hypothetical protein BN128_3762 [Cronobacter sakazakii 696]|nr:hypothetical protein BN131_2257 [Cronobacter malonaticus 681]CCK00849.1 hypothetical protein BN129_86 [Cronobacter sakazakii 701]CCK09625.1 hypothetical protein BN128_3762 [Cronobacter sakazakii 696]
MNENKDAVNLKKTISSSDVIKNPSICHIKDHRDNIAHD